MHPPVLMGISHHLMLGKLVFPGSAYQRQHDLYTLGRGTGFLLRTPAEVSSLLSLRQEFLVGLLTYLQGAKQIETAVHKFRWRQSAARLEPVDNGPNPRQGRITQELGGKIDPPHQCPTI